MELKITKEKVLEAAEKCGEAKHILTTMFPEAFNLEGDDRLRKEIRDFICSTVAAANYQRIPGRDETDKVAFIMKTVFLK